MLKVGITFSSHDVLFSSSEDVIYAVFLTVFTFRIHWVQYLPYFLLLLYSFLSYWLMRFLVLLSYQLLFIHYWNLQTCQYTSNKNNFVLTFKSELSWQIKFRRLILVTSADCIWYHWFLSFSVVYLQAVSWMFCLIV